MSTQHLSEQEIIRREKLEELKKLGIDPFPAALYPVTHHSTQIKKLWYESPDQLTNLSTNQPDVLIAGRIRSIRDMGKASFAVLQDSAGKIQIYVRKDD